MSGKDLFEGMSFVDERFVDEAENKTIPKLIISPWIRAASLAACLCLIIFSLHNLQPFLNLGEAELAAGQIAEDAVSEGSVENELKQESQESVIAPPDDGPTGEVPSVILHVKSMTGAGFTGTVVQLVDTDIFEIGMELNVVVANGTRCETADWKPAMSTDCKTDHSGSYVMVQFIEYDRETETIVVNLIHEVDPPETTP